MLRAVTKALPPSGGGASPRGLSPLSDQIMILRSNELCDAGQHHATARNSNYSLGRVRSRVMLARQKANLGARDHTRL